MSDTTTLSRGKFVGWHAATIAFHALLAVWLWRQPQRSHTIAIILFLVSVLAIIPICKKTRYVIEK